VKTVIRHIAKYAILFLLGVMFAEFGLYATDLKTWLWIAAFGLALAAHDWVIAKEAA
jgi:hypothetical protein